MDNKMVNHANMEEKEPIYYVTFILIIACIANFIATMYYGEAYLNRFLYFDENNETNAWRMLAPIFIHGGPIHLVMNMIFLYVFGKEVEKQEGGIMLLFLIVVCGYAGNISQSLNMESGEIFMGISGSLVGLIGFIFFSLFLRKNKAYPFDLYSIAFDIVLIILFAKMINALDLNIKIAHDAHMGGLFSGAVLATIFCAIYWIKNKLTNQTQ